MRALVALLGLLLASCTPVSDTACAEAVIDVEAGMADGVELPTPAWLPDGFPLPDGLTIRHLNDRPTSDGGRVLTGFVPAADPAAIAAEITSGLSEWEILFAAAGFVPVANPLLAALDPVSWTVVWVDVGVSTALVRMGDACPFEEGVIVGLVFEVWDPDEARAWFEGSSLTLGTAHAAIGGQEFEAAGECLVLDTLRSFSTTSGAGIGLQYDAPVGFASVDVEGETVLNLDIDRTVPVWEVSATGFSVEGTFIDGLGDLGLVEGRIEVMCGG